MCYVAAIPLVLTAVSGLMQSSAQKQAGREAQAEANYRAALDRNNAVMEGHNATRASQNAERAQYLANDAIERGKAEEREDRIRGRLLLGQMRVALAANGVNVDTGSGAEMQIDQAGTNELDAQTIRNNAQREAQDFRIRASQYGDEAAQFKHKANQYESQAGLNELSGANANASAKRQAKGTLLGTAGKVASSWYQFDKAGAFS